MPGLHARLAPSSAKRWIECPGSVVDEPGDAANEETVYSREGTAAHEAGAFVLREWGRRVEEVIERTFNKIEITEEMAESIGTYVELCRAEASCIIDGTELLYEIHVEDAITLEALNPPEPVWGTADCWILYEATWTLKVIDYKHGVGVVVEATNNDQGRCYALGVLLKLMAQFPEKAKRIKAIEIIIYQPRAYHAEGPIRREVISVNELIAWYRERLLPAIKRAVSSDERHAGDHCRFCRKVRCLERQRAVLDNAQLLFQEGDRETPLVKAPPKPESMTPAAIARVLDAAPALRDFLSEVERYALRSNLEIPGRKRVEAIGNRTWVDAKAIEALLVAVFCLSESQIVTRKVRSPAQVEKHLTKAEKAALKALYHRPVTGIALVPDSDPRPSVTRQDRAVELFRASDEEAANQQTENTDHAGTQRPP